MSKGRVTTTLALETALLEKKMALRFALMLIRVKAAQERILM